MPSLYDFIMDHLRGRGIAFVDRFAPYFIASTGSHLLNLWNKSDLAGEPLRFAVRNGQVRDLRLHVLMIAPPGASKSLFMKCFVDPEFGVYNATDVVMPTNCTHAGVVGSVEGTRAGVPVIHRGVFGTHQSGIIAYDEFHALNSVSTQDHSKELMDSLLSLLDSGHISRFMAHGTLDYTTYATLWGGVQQVRQRLESGLGRRLWYVYFAPKRSEFEMIKKAMRDGRSMRLNVAERNEIRDTYCELYGDKMMALRDVVFPDDWDALMDEVGVPSYEEDLMERFAMGYSVMRHYSGGHTLNVVIDRDLKTFIMRSANIRRSVTRHPMGSMVYQILSENGIEMSKTKLTKELVDLTLMRYADASRLIGEMVQDNLLQVDIRRVDGVRRPVQIITMNEEVMGDF